MEEVIFGGKKLAGWCVCCAVLYCAIFNAPSFRKSLKFCETSIASLDPETVNLLMFSILSVMFTVACGLPEKLKPRFGTALEHSAHNCETACLCCCKLVHSKLSNSRIVLQWITGNHLFDSS